MRNIALFLVLMLSVAKGQDEEVSEFHSSPGPWGHLIYHEIILEPPAHRMTLSDQFLPPITWNFPELSTEAVKQKLSLLGFDDDRIRQLEAGKEWQVTPKGTLVFPSSDFILNMTTDQRREIYDHLWERGTERVTFNIEGRDFKIFETDDFAPDLIDKVRAMSYHRGGTLVFSDSPYIILGMPDPDQKITFLKRMARTKALVVKLQIDEESDLEALASYWSVNPRQKTALPILRSITSTEGVEQIDIAHLLPPVGRKYIYTYLKADDAVWADQPDCYWTAINFAKTNPSRRVLDVGDVGFYFNEDFVPVDPPYQFGDAIVLTSEEGNFVHSYVYIADDIVYTKNGRSALYPWIMMRESDMLTRYAYRNTKKSGYRPKTALEK